MKIESSRTFASLALAFPVEGFIWLIWRFYIPQETIASKERAESVPYGEWVERGAITAVPGDEILGSFIEKEIRLLTSLYAIDGIAFDPWKTEPFIARLEGICPLTRVYQNYRTLSPMVRSFERHVGSRTILHDGNLVARWMTSNTALVSDRDGSVRLMAEPISDLPRANIPPLGLLAAVMAIGSITPAEDSDER